MQVVAGAFTLEKRVSWMNGSSSGCRSRLGACRSFSTQYPHQIVVSILLLRSVHCHSMVPRQFDFTVQTRTFCAVHWDVRSRDKGCRD